MSKEEQNTFSANLWWTMISEERKSELIKEYGDFVVNKQLPTTSEITEILKRFGDEME